MKTLLKKVIALSLCVVMCAMSLTVFADIEPGYRIEKKLSAADKAYCARQDKEGQLQQEGGFSIWRADSWVEYTNIQIPAPGTYRIGIKVGSVEGAVTMAKVSVDGEVAIDMESAVPVGLYASQIEVAYGNITFDEAKSYSIRILGTGGGAHYADYMFLEYLGEDIELLSLNANDSDILAGGSVSKGCDVITAEFSKNISTELNGDLSGKVLLKNSKGKEIAISGKVSGKKLSICLAEALEEGESYTIEFIDVKDSLDFSSITSGEYSFETVAGEGTAKLSDFEAIVNGDEIALFAKISSSQNIGIKGRSYSIYLAYGDEEAEDAVLEGVSSDNGVIEETFKMPSDSLDGEYTFILKGEYASDIEVSIIFVSKETKEAIETSLNNCTDAGEVEAVLTDATNALYLGVNPTKEIGSYNKTEVYKHFIGRELSFDEIADSFRKFVSVEAFRQSKSAIKFRGVVSKEENWNNMGLNKAKYDAVSSAKVSATNTAIIALSSIADADEYIAEIDKLLDEILLAQIGKEKAELKVEDIQAYVNQGIDFNLEFVNDISDVYAIAFKVTVSDKSLFENSEFKLGSNVCEPVEINGNDMVGLITYQYPSTVNKIGTVSLQMPENESNFNVSVVAEVVYAPSEFDFILNEAVVEKISEITTVNNPKDTPTVESQRPSSRPSGGSSRPSGGSSRPSGGSSGSSVTVKPSDDKEETKEQFSFADVSKDHWAFEAVDYLLKKGIIEETADKKFNPDAKAPREEIVKMMVLALGLTDEKAESKLSDVLKTNPYYKYIASAEKYGIIYGNDEGMFMIGKEITREDICVILHRAVKKIYTFTKNDEKFADDSMISEYAKEAVSDMYGAKIINGMGDNTFSPKGDVTKAQAAKMIYEIVKAVER